MSTKKYGIKEWKKWVKFEHDNIIRNKRHKKADEVKDAWYNNLQTVKGMIFIDSVYSAMLVSKLNSFLQIQSIEISNGS